MSSLKKDDIIPCKVIVVGDSGVGKTSIINRYLENYNADEKATIGASFSSKLQVVDKYNISFDIWDTAGEERFRSVNSIFYKEASICLIVYDITNLKSFQNIKDYWYNSVKENSQNDILFGIAGNKMDLINKEAVDQKEAEEYCKEINASFFLTSAKENDFIDQIFEVFGKRYIKSNIFQKIISQKKGIKIDSGETKKKKKLC